MRTALLLALAPLLPTGPVSPVPHMSPAPHSCTPGPYVVFFDSNSSTIKQEAREILDNAIEIEGDCGGAPMVIAHSDTAENPAIARDRAVAVRTYLASRGMFLKRRNMRIVGANELRVQTPAKTPERQNRRVEFIYGPAL